MKEVAPVFLALDCDDLGVAKEWVNLTHDIVAGYKIGLEFFATFGKEGVRALQSLGATRLFLDLKLHDIPNTVAGATRAIADLQPDFLTVHASGGSKMIAAAVSAAPDIKITAVTVLTSLNDDDMNALGFTDGMTATAVRLAKIAVAAGARAIVCSPLEVAEIRTAVGSGITLITPGVRPLSASGADDQSRTLDPKSALAAGADFLVIGRPITSAWAEGGEAMRQRAQNIAAELN